MRLFYLYDDPLPGRKAASLQIMRTLEALAERGHEVTYGCGQLSASPDAILEHYGCDGSALTLAPIFPKEFWPRPARHALLKSRLAMRRLLEADVIVTRGETGLEVLPQLAQARTGSRPLLVYELHRLCYLKDAERREGRPLAETDPLPPASARVKSREQAAVQAAEGCIYLTEAVKEAAAAAFQTEKPHLILPSGTGIPDPASSKPKTADVIYAGKIERRKGIDTLTEAMAMLPGTRAEIYGGSAEQVRSLAEEARAKGADVTLHGFQPQPVIAEAVARARIGVCPLPLGVDSVSDRFTSPMKLLEMMAHGLAVVASDIAPVRALATHGVDAWLVPPGDPSALAEGIRFLLGNQARAEAIGVAARERARGFGWEERAAKLEAYLGELHGTRIAKAA